MEPSAPPPPLPRTPPPPVYPPYAPYPAYGPPTKSRKGLWIAIIILSTLLIWSWSPEVDIDAGAKLLHSEHAEDEFPSFAEKWSYGEGDTRVARIQLFGIISRAGEETLFGSAPDLVSHVSAQIRQARNDETVRAIVLEVDSPGGGVTASDEIWNELKLFKASDEERKVIVFMRDLCASGGYYVSAAGDWLMAEPTTIVGSIGVIMSTINMKGLSEKIGIRDVTIKSGENKDLLNPLEDVKPAQLALLQKMIDSSYKRFFDIVLDARGMEESELRAVADGRVLDASEALDVGLIDEVGYWEDAIAKTAELLGVDQVKVIRYEAEPGFFDLLMQARSPIRLPALQYGQTPRLQYLWSP